MFVLVRGMSVLIGPCLYVCSRKSLYVLVCCMLVHNSHSVSVECLDVARTYITLYKFSSQLLIPSTIETLIHLLVSSHASAYQILSSLAQTSSDCQPVPGMSLCHRKCHIFRLEINNSDCALKCCILLESLTVGVPRNVIHFQSGYILDLEATLAEFQLCLKDHLSQFITWMFVSFTDSMSGLHNQTHTTGNILWQEGHRFGASLEKLEDTFVGRES